jgi:hypothetical protein
MSKFNFNFNYPISLEIKRPSFSFLNKKEKTKVLINVHPDDRDIYNNFVETELGQKMLNRVWKEHYQLMYDKNILESVAQIVVSNDLVKQLIKQERLN